MTKYSISRLQINIFWSKKCPAERDPFSGKKNSSSRLVSNVWWPNSGPRCKKTYFFASIGYQDSAEPGFGCFFTLRGRRKWSKSGKKAYAKRQLFAHFRGSCFWWLNYGFSNTNAPKPIRNMLLNWFGGVQKLGSLFPEIWCYLLTVWKCLEISWNFTFLRKSLKFWRIQNLN